MAVYTLRGRVTPDGKLEVTLPAGLGPCDVTVDIRADDDQAQVTSSAKRRLALMRDWAKEGWTGSGRSAAEIDAGIEEQRNSWDDE